MESADAKSHASLNGLYIKARVEPPALKTAPPGSSLEAGQAHASTQASASAGNTQASASAQASKQAPGRHRDASSDFTLRFNADEMAYTLGFFCFDTPNYVKVHACESPDKDIESLLLDIWRDCLRVHGLWSFSRPESDVFRINRRQLECLVDPLTADLLQSMRKFHSQEPLFDFTVGPLSFLWKHARQVPSQQRIDAAKKHVGATKVKVDGCRIVKQNPQVKVDVGGAAKGAVADMIARRMRANGIESAQVNLGGNLYLIGRHPHNRAWNVDVKIPDGIRANPIRIDVEDASVVTSGSYERFVEIDNMRYQHIVDPRTGWPSTSDIVSATVVSKSSLYADMLATTTLLASSSGFDELCARHPNCTIIAICADGRVLKSR